MVYDPNLSSDEDKGASEDKDLDTIQSVIYKND